VLVEVTDPADPRLADYTGLTDVALRSRHEPEKGLYIAESSTVIRRAVVAGHRPRSFLMAAKWLESMAQVIATSPGALGRPDGGDLPVFVAEEPVLRAITGFHLHRGALAAMHRPPLAEVADVLAGARDGRGARRVAVLEDIVDHTNVGAMFRSAAGLGVDAVLVTPRCADPLYRRSVKVAMGAVFALPWTRLPDWADALPSLGRLGFTTVALTLADDAEPVEDAVAGQERVALVLGSEGHGLSGRWEEAADRRAIIPMSGEVDSLNVAAAAAVACYVTARR
jgi:tRNA G18 (ribose-2'-O)-methylase SpoU